MEIDEHFKYEFNLYHQNTNEFKTLTILKHYKLSIPWKIMPRANYCTRAQCVA
jgi:hypothetical protein